MSERTPSADPPPAQNPQRSRPGDHALLRHTLRLALCFAILLYFLAAGLFLGLRYGVLPRIDALRPRIEAIVSDKLHAQVTIGRLTPRWSGFQPGLELTELTIRERNGQVGLRIPHASATLSWKSLWHFTPLLSSLIVDQPDLLIARASDGTLSVAGVPMQGAHSNDNAFTTWLLRQQAIVLRGGTLRWRDARHAAPELTLRDLRLAVLNDGTDHRLALQVSPDGTLLHGPLDFRVRFSHARLAATGKPGNWRGEAYMATGPVDLPALAQRVKLPIEIFAGRVDNTIWFDFADGRLTSASGKLSGAEIALRVRATQPRLNVPAARFRWALAIEPNDYTLQLHRLRAELGQAPLADGTPLTRTLALNTFTGRYRAAAQQHGLLLSVNGDRVDLGILAEFSRALPLPQRFLNELVRFDPRGLVANYVMSVERAAPDSGNATGEHVTSGDTEALLHYRLKADLQGISMAAQEPPPGLTAHNHPRAGLPGFENLWGTIDADETHGAVALDTAQGALTLPGVFDDPHLSFDRLQGRAQWTIGPTATGQPHKAFTLSVPTFSVANPDAAATLSASYSNPGHGRGSLDLKARFERAQVKRIVRYLPTSISEHLRQYLGHGLQAGVSHGATIEVRGNLDKFPYTHEPKTGVFQISAPFRGGKFDPSPYPPQKMKDGTPNLWPALEGIDGTFTLQQNLLRLDVSRGHYRRVVFSGVKGGIDDLGSLTSSFIISGAANGPLADMLDYVDQSALGGMTRHVSNRLHAEGPATLKLKLTVPHTPHPHPAVEGSLAFERNQLTLNGMPPLSQLNGVLHFSSHTAHAEQLRGRFMGGEVRASGDLQENGHYAFDVSGQMALDAAQRLELYPPAAQLLKHVRGNAPYRLSLSGARGGLPVVNAQADLTGLALAFPAPFNKPAGTPMPLRLAFQPAASAASTIAGTASSAGADTRLHRADLTFGPLTASYLLRRTAAAQAPFSVVSGAIGLNRPVELPAAGVTATADISTLDADAWRTLAAEIRPASATAGPKSAAFSASNFSSSTLTPFLPNQFAIHIGNLTLLKRHWDSVVIGASRSEDKWQANIVSNQVSGHVAWLPGAQQNSPGTLQARFARLVIPSASENDLLGQAIAAPAQNMPSIDLVVNELIVRDRPVGQLRVDAHNVEEDGVPIWRLDSLEIINPAAQLSATGNWRTARRFGKQIDEDTPRRSVFDFKLDIKDAGSLLQQAGLPHTIKAGAGTLTGKVGWRGGPTTVDYPSLGGHLALDLRHGEILKVDPGVAKLLGVLSLQSLTRLLSTLSFRDVIGEGLPFEHVSGTGTIRNGVGRTDDFELVTAPARADLQGSVDLAHETQDLRAHIVPTLSAGAAVVAVTVINPLLGLGALAADLALTQSIAVAFAQNYAITGSWSKPHIERVHGDHGKMSRMPATATEAE
ncbi:YhdP family protein [Paraburkholderia bonniea]|uniref:YhdP family protein n=1 Tax=Paraburkholderia bonniea TaxID=2152891 RepID=UPI0012910E30|nr:YhdP family protein [Paraburkholderia bonniea]WJF89780.1 YhdP family protein [Paraburkholderia bonniea]WJF93094.1 YhdP family protein [Paraburkholderia bonniea]